MSYQKMTRLFILFLSIYAFNCGTINDVEHIILFMQENRPFDHYYGTLKGVRGFDDRAHPPILSTKRPIFYQPVDQANLTKYQLPWHVDSLRTSATCMDAPDMSFYTDTAIWNHGKMDMWNTAREQGMGMAYFNRTDLPYYYALADEFTIGDQYYQSTFTETDPNRVFFFSGCNGKSAGRLEQLNNDIPEGGLLWKTVAEIFEEQNITWKVYQEFDNFDDNAFAWFRAFQQAKEGEPLYEKGMRRVEDLVKEFGKDMDENKLPQVSFIVARTNLSEHATNHPAAGEDLTARLVEELKKRPETYKKSAFILNYDEGGQFFDHHWTPTPPASSKEGKSTVDVESDLATDRMGTRGTFPMGMGFRVPLTIVSPWTRGGFVVSEVFDHTSILRFIEKRFNIDIPNISEWRRAVAGDLTSAFDFENPDYSFPDLPSTVGIAEESIVQCDTLPKPQVPVEQTYPTQEPGVRKARVLPYLFKVNESFEINENDAAITISIEALGKQGGAFQAYDYVGNFDNDIPLKYTVHTGAKLTDSWKIKNSNYDFSLHGPNGFVRRYSGNIKNTKRENIINNCFAVGDQDTENGYFIVSFVNSNYENDNLCNFEIKDTYNSSNNYLVSVKPNQAEVILIDVKNSGNWYDVTIVQKQETQYESANLSDDIVYLRRFMGRIEREGNTSDPAVGNPFHQFEHPTAHMKSEYFLPSKYVKGDKRNKDSYRCYGINNHNNMCRNEEGFKYVKYLK